MIYNFSTSEKIRLDEFLRRELPLKVKGAGSAKAESDASGKSEGRPENPVLSNSKIRRLIISGSVSVNGRQVVRPAFELRGKSNVTVQFDEEKFFFEKQPEDISFDVRSEDVLFEDEYLIIVNKPAHFPTEKTIVGDEKRDNLHAAVVRYLWKKNPALRNPPYAGIMHRLDRDTSGAILFTKQRTVNKAISEMFEKHDFTKIYQALCTQSNSQTPGKQTVGGGTLKTGDTFTVEGYMSRSSSKTQAAKWELYKTPAGREDGALYSKTDFKVLEECTINSRKCFRVQANLFTGRTHQIRVHLSSKGLPILGDTLYGGEAEERIYLHASLLSFKHPVTGETITANAPLPF